MRFLVDAQLPRRLAHWLVDAGYDALHTLDLPDRNRTSDDEIVRLVEEHGWVLITKDDDFVYSFLVDDRPERLLLVSTGNISNRDLLALFEQRIQRIAEGVAQYRFVELTRETVLVHE